LQQIARELDYRPDAMLAALNAYRVQRSSGPERPVLAWLTHHAARNAWRLSACNVDYYKGALRRAEERGYRLEHFWLGEPGMSPRRMSDVLRTRGIQGLLLPPQEKIGAVELDWADFAAVTFGYTLLQPRLHLVSNHEYRTMGTLFGELAQRAYRRVGLVDLREHDERVDHNWLAAYLLEQHRLGAPQSPPPLILEQWSDDRFLDWVERHAPDAIVTKLPAVLDCLRRAAYAVPAEIGVAFHSLDDGSTGLSGMRKNASQIGVMAVDLLVDMLHRNERGVPAEPHLLMVEGTWVEGATLRPPATATRALLPAPVGDVSRS
jgi:DNA-binding LacI/PurR family transcriptional regulator